MEEKMWRFCPWCGQSTTLHDGDPTMTCGVERSDDSVDYTRGMAKKRSYSREFTPKTERRVMLTIDRIPPTLYDAVKAKAKREGVSLRSLILGWLKNWIDQ